MLLPAADRRGEIHFYFAKRLPYNVRLAVAFALIAAGWTIQMLFLTSGPWIAGLPGVVAGVALLLVRGFDNTTPLRRSTDEWRPARRIEVERILELNRKQRKWDQDAIDITNARGGLVFVALLIALAGVWMYVINSRLSDPSGRYIQMLAANAAVMLFPFWFTGVRSILKNDRLVIKAEMLLRIEDAFNKGAKSPREEFKYQIQTAEAKRGEGEMPCDVKALVRFHDGPSDFLGVQMQIAINSVQGTDYPYLYCVLVARESFGELSKTAKPEPPPRNIVLEPKHENNVHILVVRQKTTKNSGYHTNQKTAHAIFDYAIRSARRLIAA